MPYYHITLEERVKIEAWKDAGHSNGEIAEFLGRDRSTIGRELRRSDGDHYRAKAADKRRREVRKKVNKQLQKIIPNSPLAQDIEKRLRTYWSPEQITGRMRKERKGAKKREIPCHETIYQFIYHICPELKPFLRCRKGKYRRRYGTKIRENRREKEKKQRIDTRPKIVETRGRIGDWEGDTIVGGEKTKHILTHVDRKSRYLLADKIDQATAASVRKKTVARFNKIAKKKRHTITYDNGVQFEEHEITARETNTNIYFAYPYHSWERGTNENTNGLLRQFFPKKSLFKEVTQQRIDRVAKLLNTRPRKRLDYQTPQEVFSGCCGLT